MTFAIRPSSPTPDTCAVAYGQLGEREAALKALKELLSVRPSFATSARKELEKWSEPELVEHSVEGLRKAGLEIVDDSETPPPKPAAA